MMKDEVHSKEIIKLTKNYQNSKSHQADFEKKYDNGKESLTKMRKALNDLIDGGGDRNAINNLKTGIATIKKKNENVSNELDAIYQETDKRREKIYNYMITNGLDIDEVEEEKKEEKPKEYKMSMIVMKLADMIQPICEGLTFTEADPPAVGELADLAQVRIHIYDKIKNCSYKTREVVESQLKDAYIDLDKNNNFMDMYYWLQEFDILDEEELTKMKDAYRMIEENDGKLTPQIDVLQSRKG